MKILKFTLIVSLLSLFTRIIGFIREAVIANELGVSQQADAVYVALTIPNVFQFVIGAAVANSLTPKLIRVEKELGNEERNKLFSRVLLSFLLILILLGMVISLFVEEIVFLIAPDLGQEAISLTVDLILIAIPASIAIAVIQVFKQVLQMQERVWISNLGQLLLNIVAILFIVIFRDFSAAYTMMFGLIVGSLLAVFIQLLVIKRSGFSHNGYKGESKTTTREVFATAMTIGVGLLLSQLFLIVNRIFASGLDEGSIAALSYGEKVIQLPNLVIAQSLGIVIFPFLAKLVAEEDLKNLGGLLTRSLKIVLLLCIPISIYVFVYSEDIVRVLFERGAFDSNAVFMTQASLSMFSFMLIGQSIMMVLTRYFYAIDKARIPLIGALVCLFLNIIFTLVLREYFDHAGIALANTLAFSANAVFLLYMLKPSGVKINVHKKGIGLYSLVYIIFLILAIFLDKYINYDKAIINIIITAISLSVFYILILGFVKEEELLVLLKKIRQKLKL